MFLVGVPLLLLSLHIADLRGGPLRTYCGRECWSGPLERGDALTGATTNGTGAATRANTSVAVNASTSQHSINVATPSESVSEPTTLPVHLVEHANLVRMVDTGGKMTKLQSILAKFRALLPRSFLPEYKNPCWEADYRFEHRARDLASAFRFDGAPDPKHEKQAAISRVVVEDMQRGPGAKTLVCLPSFFLPGYSKCGTTELFKMLQAHPDFAPPASKELNWWTWKPWDDEAPLNTSYLLRYFSYFSPAAHRIQQNRTHRITADMSVLAAFDLPFKLTRTTTYDDSLMFLISSILPHSKIIFMMRDPVYKVRSAYYFFSKFGCPRRLSAEELHRGVVDQVTAYRRCLSDVQVDAEFECLYLYLRYVNLTVWPCYVLTLPQAVYYHSITLWMRHFPRDQLLFLRMEDLAHNATDMAQQVFSFLGLSPPSPRVLHAVAQQAQLRANANFLLSRAPEATTMWPETKALLKDFFAPFNIKLAELLGDTRYLWKDVD